MDVSKNRGKTPKWMVYFMENPINMDDLGYPYFWKHPYTKSCTLLSGFTTSVKKTKTGSSTLSGAGFCQAIRIISRVTKHNEYVCVNFLRLSTSQISLQKVFEWGIPRYSWGNPGWVS